MVTWTGGWQSWVQGDDVHECRGMMVMSVGGWRSLVQEDDGRECRRVINMSAGKLEGLLAWGLWDPLCWSTADFQGLWRVFMFHWVILPHPSWECQPFCCLKTAMPCCSWLPGPAMFNQSHWLHLFPKTQVPTHLQMLSDRPFSFTPPSSINNCQTWQSGWSQAF